MTNSTLLTRYWPSSAIRNHPSGMRPEFQSESRSSSTAKCADSCPDEGITSPEAATFIDDNGVGVGSAGAAVGMLVSALPVTAAGEAAAAVTVGWAGAGLGVQAAAAHSANNPIAAMQQFFISISLAGWGSDPPARYGPILVGGFCRVITEVCRPASFGTERLILGALSWTPPNSPAFLMIPTERTSEETLRPSSAAEGIRQQCAHGRAAEIAGCITDIDIHPYPELTHHLAAEAAGRSRRPP